MFLVLGKYAEALLSMEGGVAVVGKSYMTPVGVWHSALHQLNTWADRGSWYIIGLQTDCCAGRPHSPTIVRQSTAVVKLSVPGPNS
jgi:hypothetical protein